MTKDERIKKISSERSYEDAVSAAAGNDIPDEKKERLATMRTRGVKGLKLQRISMAFSPDNADFIRLMATVRGETMTDFVNTIVTLYREQHKEAAEKAKKILEEFNNDNPFADLDGVKDN